MSEIYGYSNREAIRVKVKKYESNIPSEWRKFSIDPQITSLEVLYSILAKAFDIKSDFSICYKTLDSAGDESYLAVLSDWDLDAAFLKAHNISVQTGNEPCLSLRVDIKTTTASTEFMNDWESGVGGPQISRDFFSLQQSIDAGQKYVQNMQNKLPGLIMNQMEKTFSMVQRALNLSDDQVLVQPPRPPLSDSEFRSFLDSVGQILRPNELRKVIFIGGIDPSLRKVVWKHILNIYPSGMTGRDRIDYMKKKAAEYYKLREVWKTVVQKGGPVVGELAYVTSMVRKDVLRTDRLHPFYAGSDDNQNIASLFNILTTYALNHPSVSYCQGMSDIASPLLVTMGDEAHAYICFCAIMSRLKENFMLDGVAMTLKFTHLAEALHFYDPEFYDYLKLQQADDLLFCYRWLLLEMKREFAFEDSLRMLEVLWSSLRYEPPIKELNLYEKEFEPSLNVPVSPSPSVALRQPRENHYTKVCALRRQSSSASLISNSFNFGNSTDLLNDIGKLNVTKRLNHSLDENIPRLTRSKNVVIKSHQSLDENKMIRLMESMTMLEEKTIDQTQTETIQNSVIINNDQEDESTITTATATAFNFHPTNPFFNDADDITKTETFDNEQNMVVIDNGILEPLNTDLMMITTTTNEEKQIKDLKLNCLKSPNNNTKMQNKHFFNATTAEEIISKQLTNKNSGHFKELKEKLAASKKGIKTSLDKIDNQLEIATKNRSQSQNSVLNSRNSESNSNLDVVKNQKFVKNFKEFLNLSSSINKNHHHHQINEIIPVNANKINTKDDKGGNSGGGGGGNMVNSRSLDSCDNNSSSRLYENATISSSNSNNSQIDDKIIRRQQFDDEQQRMEIQVPIPKYKIQQKQQHHQSSIQSHKHQQTQQYFDDNEDDDDDDDSNDSPSVNLNQNQNEFNLMKLIKDEELQKENESKLESSLDEVFGSDETLPISITKNNNNSSSRSSSRFMCDTDIKYEKLDRDSIDTIDVVCSEMIIKRNNQDNDHDNQNDEDEVDNFNKRISTCSTGGNDVFVWENPLHQMSEASSCNFNEININENNFEINKFNTNNSSSSTADDSIIDKSTWRQSNNAIKTTKILSSPSNVLSETKNTTQTTATFPINNTTKNNNYCNVIDSNVTMTTDNRNNLKNSSNSFPLLKTNQQQQQQQQQSNNQILNVFKETSTSLSLQQNNEKSNDHDIIGMNTTSSTNSITNCTGGSQSATTRDVVTAKINNTSTSTTINNTTTTMTTNSCFSKINILPTPKEFGGGNPFLIFLCLTLLIQHRNFIMKNGLDYNEMAMHFDKMVRKHDVNRVLNQARRMYFEYLKTQHQLYQQQLQKQQQQQQQLQQQQQQLQQQQQQNSNRVSSSTTNYLESYSNNYKS